MFYEPYRRERRGGRSCLGCLVRFALLLAAALAVVFLATSGLLDKLMRPGPYRQMSASRALPAGWTNVLLLGADAAQEGTSRTDTIIVASVSAAGELKLTSIMRDTLVSVEGHGKQKINAAYTYGGAEGTASAVNRYFGLNITRYAVIDYAGFASLVDAAGGVEVSVTQKEMQAMNRNLDTDAKRKNQLVTYGESVRLNGAQALRFARIRKLDSDYRRAARQRAVIEALIRGIAARPLCLPGVVKTAAQAIKTNMSPLDIAGLGARVLLSGKVSQLRLPADGTYESGTKDGVWSIRPDFDENARLLKEFIYG